MAKPSARSSATRAATTAAGKRAPVRHPTSAGRRSAAAEIGAHAGDPNYMASLARGLAVIRAFSQHRARVSIGQLSMSTEIPRAAVRRVLYTLRASGYVGSDDGRTFMLHPRILALGYAYLSSTPLVTSAQPLLDKVSQAIHESCSMALLDGDDVMYVARSLSSRRIMSFDLVVGSRLPAYCASMGRVLLAHLPPLELAAYLRRVKILPHTERTERSKDKLASILEAVRAKAYAVIDQELEIGLRSIAVPVTDSTGRVAVALNVCTHAARVTVGEMERRFLPLLRTTARDVGMLLG
jgi:IclR family transcriptional regulator, pca regulon regulatory protein